MVTVGVVGGGDFAHWSLHSFMVWSIILLANVMKHLMPLLTHSMWEEGPSAGRTDLSEMVEGNNVVLI